MPKIHYTAKAISQLNLHNYLQDFPKTMHGVRFRFKNLGTKQKNKFIYPFKKFPKTIQEAIIQAEKSQTSTVSKDFKELSMVDLLKSTKTENTESPGIVPGLLSPGASILAGKPKDGKSVLAVNWGLAVACGAKVFKSFPCDAGPVLYLSYEDPEYRVKARIEQMLKSGDFEVSPNFKSYFDFPRMDAGGFTALDQEMARHGARFVIIDVLVKFRSDDDSKRTSYRVDYNFMNKMHDLGINHNACVLLIHHRTKGVAKDIMDTFSGSSGLIAPADGLMILSRMDDSPMAELATKNKDFGSKKYQLVENEPCLLWELNTEAKTNNMPGCFNQKLLIMDVLSKTNPAKPIKLKEIVERTGCKSSYVKKVLAGLLKSGEVYKPFHGSYVYLKRG